MDALLGVVMVEVDWMVLHRVYWTGCSSIRLCSPIMPPQSLAVYVVCVAICVQDIGAADGTCGSSSTLAPGVGADLSVVLCGDCLGSYRPLVLQKESCGISKPALVVNR